MKILVLTVGGSCAPIVTSINQHKPDKIYFVCSENSIKTVEGEGKVCGQNPKEPNEPNILIQTGIEKYEIETINEIDAINECFKQCNSLIKKIKNEFPDANITTDYTGGTKSMSAGLVMSSFLNEKISLCFVSGNRQDLVKVQNKTETLNPINFNEVYLEKHLEKQFELMDNFYKRYDYDGVISIVDKLSLLENIPSKSKKLMIKRKTFSKGFLAWDCFNHEEALSFLVQYKKDMVENIKFLECVISSKKEIDGSENEKPKGHGYEVVEDLFLNSQRRAEQGKYDDSVGRLYRALELLAQIRLKKEYNIDTGDLDINKVPELCREKYEVKKDDKGKIEIGLKDSYELLVFLNDKLGKLYSKYKNNLIGVLEMRNMSLFAHGFKPVDKEDYNKFSSFFKEFIDTFFIDIKVKFYGKRCEFPCEFPLEI